MTEHKDVQIDVPTNDQVRVKIISSGICASDAHFVWGQQKYTDFPGWKLPAVLGHEAAAVVESIGDNVEALQVGDHVLTIFMPACGQCDLCLNPLTNMCKRDNLLSLGSVPNKKLLNGTGLYGMAGLGVYSEYALLKENQLYKVDNRANLEQVCIVSCSICTGFFSTTNLAKVTAGSTCAVWGLGAIGLNAVIGCKYNQAKHIIGIDINNDKMEVAFAFGCTEFVNPTEMGIPIEQYLQEKYGGVDFALECIGNQNIMNSALKSLSMIGTLAIIGIARKGTQITCEVGDLMTGKKIVGAFLGNKKTSPAYKQMISMVINGQIDLARMITKTFTLGEINEAFQMLKDGKCIRSVILMN